MDRELMWSLIKSEFPELQGNSEMWWGVLGNRRVISQGSREWMHGGVTVSHKGDQHNIQVVWSLGEGLVLLEVQARG